MAELNFIVDQTALATVKNTVINANFDEMKEALTEFAKPYKSVIVSEDAIGIAKADRARIRAVSKHIDDYRKMIKNVYSEPLKAFEAKCKELTGICDEASSNIDTQVKAYEERRKEEKLFLLHEYFEGVQKTMSHGEYITWEQVENPKWGNVTYSMDMARKDIETACSQVDKEVQEVIDLSSEFQLALLDNYKKTHDIFGTFQMQERLASQKMREEQKQRELEAQYKEQRAQKIADDIKNQSNPKPQEVGTQTDQLFMATVRVVGTATEISSLQSLLRNLKVKHMVLSTEPIDVPADAVLG